MNIKDHINAGHYPLDDKGRALVPTSGGGTVTIATTDRPGSLPIIGWSAEGHLFTAHADGGGVLLPPPPRKVPKKAWLLVRNGHDYGTTHNPETADLWRESIKRAELRSSDGDHVVELTGEIEEPR